MKPTIRILAIALLTFSSCTDSHRADSSTTKNSKPMPLKQSIGKSTMTEKDKRNIESVRKMYQGENSEFNIISKDIIWHVPGHNPVSGTYTGYEEYAKVMTAKMAPLQQWDFTLEDIMVNGDYVVATFRVIGERKGKKINMKGAHIMRLNETGQVVEGWGFADDQDALDDFFTD